MFLIFFKDDIYRIVNLNNIINFFFLFFLSFNFLIIGNGILNNIIFVIIVNIFFVSINGFVLLYIGSFEFLGM